VSEIITVVTGLGRCGTSMVMSMLDAGGMPVFCGDDTDGARGTSYEANGYANRLPEYHDWLDRCVGKAVKVLDPIHFGLPHGRRYRFVLLDRNAEHQAKSQCKVLRLMSGLNTNINHRKRMAKANAADITKTLKILESMGPVLRISFESVLRDPTDSARRLADFVGIDFEQNGAAMAGRVLERDSACAPGLEIELAALHRVSA